MIAVRRATRALLAALTLAVSACHHSRPAAEAVDAHARVYATVIQELLAQQQDSARQLVVLDTLLPGDMADDQVTYVGERLHVDRALVERFVGVQRSTTMRFSVPRTAPTRVVTIAHGVLDSLQRAARATASEHGVATRSDVFWRSWYTLYPNSTGFVILSPAVLSDDGRDALVYVAHSCGALCGNGEIRHLRRSDSGEWRQAGAVELWVS